MIRMIVEGNVNFWAGLPASRPWSRPITSIVNRACAPSVVIRIFSARISTIFPLVARCALSVSDLRTGVEAHSTIDLRPQHHAPLPLILPSLRVKLQISLLRPILGLKLVATLMKARKS